MIVESFSGVRGLVGSEITPAVASDYAAAYCSTFKKRPKLVIGHDTRPSSSAVHNAMVKRLSSMANVISLGIASTPATELMVRELKADGGIMITASHNEPHFNGWKFLSKSGAVLEPKLMTKVIKAYHARKSPVQSRVRKVVRKSSVRPYLKFLKSYLTKKDISAIKGFSVWFDPNGGSAIPYLNGFIRMLGLKGRVLNGTIGKFNRLVEPNEKSLSPLAKKLKGDSFVIGFDCDADRAEFVLPTGVVSGQYVLAFVVQSVLSRTNLKRPVVVTNDATSGIISELAKTVEVEVGEINVVSKMEQLGSIVGGEGSSSGGIVPPSKCRDGLLSLVLLLRLLASEKKSLSKLLSEFPVYHTPRKNMKGITKSLDWIADRLKKDGAKVIRHGGKNGSVKGVFEKGWVWFRASKTENGVFRVISDSKSKKEADRLLKYGVGLLSNS